MSTPKTTASFRLPPLDTKRLAEHERQAVAALLATATDDESRLRIAAGVVNEATREIERLRPQRDNLALSLRFYDNARALSNTLGIVRGAFVEKCLDALDVPFEPAKDGRPAKRQAWLNTATREQIEERATGAHVKRVPAERAKAKLPRLAEKVYRAQVRLDAAIGARDAAIIELWESADWLRDDLAAIAEVNPSRISQIVATKKKRLAA